MDLPQAMILEYTDLVAPGPVIASRLKGYAIDDCYAGRCPSPAQASPWPWRMGYQCYENPLYNSSQICCWSLPADLFLVNRFLGEMSGQVFFSSNEFVMNVLPDQPLAPLVWSPTHSGRGPSYPSTGPSWCLASFLGTVMYPNAAIPYMAFSHAWRSYACHS